MVKSKFYKLYLVLTAIALSAMSGRVRKNQVSLVKLQANSRLLPHTDCGKTRYVWLSAINLQT